MVKNFSIAIISLLVLSLVSCKPTPEPPEVDIVPPAPRSPHALDTANFYVQFTLENNKDTITMMEPVDTSAMDSTYYFQIPIDIKNVPVIDTFEVDEDTDPEDLDTIGWTYAPSGIMYHYNYILEATGRGEFTSNQTKNIFRISFPYTRHQDSLPVWDIDDYLNNPSIQVGPVKWGRVSVIDTLFNVDARDGVMISYIDENGMEWKTDNKPTFQPASYFQIDSLYKNTQDDASYFIMVGRCAARLYNYQGYKRDILNGKFKMRILTDIELGPQPE